VALATIGLLCILSSFFVNQVSRNQTNDAEIIDIAARQRLLTVQMVQYLEDIRDGRSINPNGRATSYLLQRARADWLIAHRQLQQLAQTQNLSELNAVVNETGTIFGALDQIARRAIASESISEAAYGEARLIQKEYLNKQTQVIRYLLGLHETKISRLNQIQTFCSLLIVLVVIAEGVWVFRPLVRGLQDKFDRESDQREELEAIRRELGDQNQSLHHKQRELSHALRRAEDMSKLSRYAAARFEELFAGLPIAAFTFDESGDVFEWNREAETLFGIKAPQVVGRNLTEFRVLPNAGTQYLEIVKRVFSGEHIYDLEQSIRRSDNQIRTAVCNAFPLTDPDGNITGGVCSLQDVTEARKEALRIQESESLFRVSTESLQSGIVFMDRHLKITQCNPRGAEILGVPLDHIVGESMNHQLVDCICEDGSPLVPESGPLLVAFRTRRPVQDFIYGIRRDDGRITWISVNASPVQLPGASEPIGAVASFTDITNIRIQQRRLLDEMQKTNEQSLVLEVQKMELEAANARLEDLATTDGLTGLKNHRSFQEFLEREFALAARNNRRLSIILLDVDHFKQFNDDFGHQAGDKVLKGVADALLAVARTSDFVGRYGGEEFVIVLPETDTEGAMEAAERFRKIIEDQKWPYRTVTASFGVSTLSPMIDDKAELVALADAALYTAKRLGRNQCFHASELRQTA